MIGLFWVFLRPLGNFFLDRFEVSPIVDFKSFRTKCCGLVRGSWVCVLTSRCEGIVS